MTTPASVVVVSRDSDVPGSFTSVRATVDNGATHDYMIATELVGTPGEIDEIRAQHGRRMEAIDIAAQGT